RGEHAYALAGEKPRYSVLASRRAENPRIAEPYQRGAFGVLLVMRDDLERAKLIGASAVGAHDGAQPTPTAGGRANQPGYSLSVIDSATCAAGPCGSSWR